jgi:hypothetical protein
MEENIEGEKKKIRQRRTTNDWETLGIKFLKPTEEDFDEILDFYLKQFVPGTNFDKYQIERTIYV